MGEEMGSDRATRQRSSQKRGYSKRAEHREDISKVR